MALIRFVIVLAWMSGVLISIFLNINFKAKVENWDSKNNKNMIKKTQHYFISKYYWFTNQTSLNLIGFLIFLILSFFRVYTFKWVYDSIFILLLVISFYFFINYTQKVKWNYTEKCKKIIKWFANYTLMLFLLHYSLFQIFYELRIYFPPHLLFFIAFLISNILSATLAYFTEIRHLKLRNYLIKKFNLIYSIEAVKDEKKRLKPIYRYLCVLIVFGLTFFFISSRYSIYVGTISELIFGIIELNLPQLLKTVHNSEKK